MKYNYVFFNVSTDYIKSCYGLLDNTEGIEVYSRAFNTSWIIEKLFFLHWSNRINSRIYLPFKSIWFKKMCNKGFKNSRPYCYVFLEGKYILEDSSLIKYIRKNNPNNKCIIYCTDLISKSKWNIKYVKKYCDYIVTYDKDEADKYKINCFSKPCYSAILPVTEPDLFETDVYFLGYAKDRLDMIHSTYKLLSSKGLRCKFIICGVSKEKQIKGNGLIYSFPISYRENLENVQKSKCILEIMQGGSNAATLRTEEAQVYKRKLLTNHVDLVNQEYYDENNMTVFSNPEDIDINFIKSPIDYKSFNNGYDYSPMKLIDYFEKLLG